MVKAISARYSTSPGFQPVRFPLDLGSDPLIELFRLCVTFVHDDIELTPE